MIKQLSLLLLTLNCMFIGAVDHGEQNVHDIPDCNSLDVLAAVASDFSDCSDEDDESDSSDDAQSGVKRSRDVFEEAFYCRSNGCGKSFTDHSNLRCHIKSVHEGKRFICTFLSCGKAFTSSSGRRKHVKSFHEELD